MLFNLTQLGWSHNNAILASGFASGALTSFITNPLWTLKSLSQLKPQNAVQELAHKLHPRVLMSGTYISIVNGSIGSMLQLFVLEKLKELNCDKFNTLTPIKIGVLAGISRVLILPIAYPLSVITLRCRESATSNKSGTLINIIKGIYKQKAWYAGSLPYICRALPQSVGLFFIYESIKTILQHRK